MRAAAVDIGSNSIKLLVAERSPSGGIDEVLSRNLEVRISAGISSAEPRLSEDGIENGVAAVAELLAETRRMGADRVGIVATSAVRDASNGLELRQRVRAATGLEVRILSGDEEANLVARGLSTDPALAHLSDFRLFDLGGGSLECLAFRGRKVESAASVPLGCVRLTEKFVKDRTAPFRAADADAIGRHVREVLGNCGFPLAVPAGMPVVGTGGTLTNARAVAAARSGEPLQDSDPVVDVAALRALLSEVGAMDLASRRRVVGLHPERADVFPAALATLVTLAQACGFDAFRHSLRNLRWGVASEMLGRI
jgi:exopolyphosphatase/guanosine-5'-triphosphate,3'-diphosphate pyrophosphatase